MKENGVLTAKARKIRGGANEKRRKYPPGRAERAIKAVSLLSDHFHRRTSKKAERL